ncbi:hypothetical protein [Marinobacter sp.]|uniref:hypothetical protein n=1 Tax=Marinobacter sp. TaxID=50741 RepID=UPI00257E49D6|nr:hypothetical protein [Marinobacter sp.]|tara:strand:- start:499 stop:2895 length:2397 start_codon:yes stop_codon:yes gene_type:complete
MSYSIHGKIPEPQIVRFEADRPALLDRYDDVRILRQNLLLHQRVKIPPNEAILKGLRKKKKGLKRTKNLRGEVARNIREQKRFERGERRDRADQEPRIIGEPVRGAGGIAFDPEIEREKINLERDKLLLGQGRLALDGRQLNINRALQIADRGEQARQFNLLLQERQDQDRERIRVEEEARRERLDGDLRQAQERLQQEDRARREALEFDERRQAQALEAQRAELETRLIGEEGILRENRNAEFRLLQERNQFEVTRAAQARQEREAEDARRQTSLDALERARQEQVGLLREQADLNRQVVETRISEVDREREQRREQREADYLQRGLHEIDSLITRRINQAAREFRRGGLADPEPEITILGGERRARAETTRGALTPDQRADLSADIAATIRAELQRSPRDIVRQAQAERQQAEEQEAQIQEGERELTLQEATPLTEEQQRRVDATRRAVARRRTPSPNPQEDPLSDEGSLDPFGSGRERELRRAFQQTEREAQAEAEFYERQPSPGSPLDEIPAERLRRGGGRGSAVIGTESSSEGSGELIFNIDEDEVEGEQQEGLLAAGGRLLQQAGGAVIQGAGHAIQRGIEAVEELQRPGIGEQTGGRLDPEGEIVGLGQEIEVDVEPEPSPRDRPAIPPVITAEELIQQAEGTGATQEGRGQVEEIEETPAVAAVGTPGESGEEALIEEVEQEGRGVSGAAQRSNYSEYQALRGDLDELAGRRGGKRKAGVPEFIPFEITNVSDKTLKKIEPGQTIQLKGVLKGGEVRYEVPGTLKSTKIQTQVLDKLIREGKLKISRKTG